LQNTTQPYEKKVDKKIKHKTAQEQMKRNKIIEDDSPEKVQPKPGPQVKTQVKTEPETPKMCIDQDIL